MCVFPRLNALDPGFLKKDSIKFAKASGMFHEGLEKYVWQRINWSKYDTNIRLTCKSEENRIETEERGNRSEISIKLRALCHHQSH